MAMKLFISWSAERSGKLASALRDWIKMVIQDVDPWVSKRDLESGSRWLLELGGELDNTNFGVVCLSPESLTEPWVIFEAGALSKKVEQARVCPYLLDLNPTDVKGPLAQFQSVRADKEGTSKLVRDINNAVRTHDGRFLEERDLDETINKWWPDLKRRIESIGPARTETRTERTDREILEEILEAVRKFDRSSSGEGGLLRAFATGRKLKDIFPEMALEGRLSDARISEIIGGGSLLERDKSPKE